MIRLGYVKKISLTYFERLKKWGDSSLINPNIYIYIKYLVAYKRVKVLYFARVI